MKKYDCTKTRDCLHEYRRLCDSHPAGCESGCPFIEEYELCGFDIFESEDNIALLQKWSDEHPEPPKLTKREHDFLEMIVDDGLTIGRTRLGLEMYSKTGEGLIFLDWRSFNAVDRDSMWAVEELLKLEVEE